jgi:valyl-tRNA synthetase
VNRSAGAAREFETLRQIVTAMRRLRADYGVEPAKQAEFIVDADLDIEELVGDNLAWITRLANASSIEPKESVPQGWAVEAIGTTTVGLNLAGAIDVAKERARIEKEIGSLRAYIKSTETKLRDRDLLSRAPPEVVRQMGDKLEEARAKQATLERRLEVLKA